MNNSNDISMGSELCFTFHMWNFCIARCQLYREYQLRLGKWIITIFYIEAEIPGVNRQTPVYEYVKLNNLA